MKVAYNITEENGEMVVKEVPVSTPGFPWREAVGLVMFGASMFALGMVIGHHLPY